MIELKVPQFLLEKQKLMQVSAGSADKALSSKKAKVVLIYNHNGDQLPVSQKEMLDRLVVACKFDKSETAYLNCFEHQYKLGFVLSAYSPSLVLVFGDISLSQNIVRMVKNHAYEISGAIVIRTESIDNLEKVKGEKSKLWDSLCVALKL